MAIAYRIYKTLGLTLVVWDGNVTGDEAEDQVRTLREDPDWPPGPLHLLDVTSVTEPPIVANTKLVEMLAELADAHQIRFALVATGASDEGARFQNAATAAGVSRVIVFSDLAPACSWLEIDLSATTSILDTLRRQLRGEQQRPDPA